MFELPHRLGRYELLELLAVGGMAEIYRARMELPLEAAEKELAIKRILPHLAGNREFINMFVDEARITLPLSHGNIVQVYELAQEGSDYFLVMEYVRGRNLETVLERVFGQGQQVPLEVATFIGYEAARGLDYAHRFRDAQDRPAGIVHRDISPQNILVGFQGEVKITDFGIARARSRIRSTSQGIIRGKACYLSPEQAECRDLDGRSDVFSLGVVLYETISGRRPFEGPDEVATLELVRRAAPAPLGQWRSDVGPELEEIVMRCLRREPAERHADAGAVYAALARVLHRSFSEFSGSGLAAWMRSLFSGEIEREKVARRSREHIAAGAAGGKSAGVPTVDIRSRGSAPTAPARRSWWMLWLPALAVALALAGYAWWSNSHPAGGTDAGVWADAGMEPDVGPATAAAEPDGADGPSPPAGDVDATDGEAQAVADRPPPRLGRLDINSRPWAQVWIDGHRLKGETPLFNVPVPSGRHRLRFYNPELKIGKTVEVDIEPGGHRKVTEELSAP